MRIVLLVAGVALVGYGLWGFLTHDGSAPVGQLVFMAVLLVVHDAVVMPLVLGAGLLLHRFVPPVARPPALAALAVSAAVSVVALPFVIGAGRIADNPSAFPQSYGRGLLLVLAVVWSAAGIWAVVRAVRRRA